MAQMPVFKHFQKFIKNIRKMIFEKFFLQLLLFLFEVQTKTIVTAKRIFQKSFSLYFL